MSEQEPVEIETPEPEVVEVRPRRPLPLAITWGLTPAILMSLAGVFMELKADDAFSGICLFLGTIGGVPLLFGWSVWLVYPANWTTPAKVVAVFPIAIAMCVANLLLAVGACAVIDPPFHIQ